MDDTFPMSLLSLFASPPPPPPAAQPTSRNDDDALVVARLLVSILESEPAWTTAASTARYYDSVAQRIRDHDPELMSTILDVASKVRARYRTHTQHQLRVLEVPYEIENEEAVEERLDSDCTLCLTPLKSHRPLARTRCVDGSTACGHFFHASCLSRVKADALTGNVACPVCRANLGPRPLATYMDLESDNPEY